MSGKNALPIEDHPEKWVEERIKDFIGSEVNRLTLDGQVIAINPWWVLPGGTIPSSRRYKKVIGIGIHACGLWQTGVPCEFEIPSH